jgi:signal transduction histidine kinase
MLVEKNGDVSATLLYQILFIPFMLITIAFLLGNIFKQLSRGSKFQRQVMRFHLIGGGFLSIGATIDMLAMIKGTRVVPEIPNFTIVGVLSFCSVVGFVFTNRLTELIMEREVVFKKLKDAYKELEDVQVLKELGESTSILNHEIRNYATAISGFAEMLNNHPGLDAFSKKMADRIIESATRMTNFSKEILEFSKLRILKSKSPFEFFTFLKNCIDYNFQNNLSLFEIENNTNSINGNITGDWHKLDQAFLNIFKNSIEAKACKIKIKINANETMLFCNIEDDGIGCSPENLKQIFKAFFTTKKESGGTGLGMSVVRSIIEGHGGKISAYTKNNGESKEHGMGFNIVFPKYEQNGDLSKYYKNNLLFITDGIKDLSIPVQVFRNTLINPHLFKTVKEIDTELLNQKSMFLIATAENTTQFKHYENVKVYIIVESDDGLYVVDEKSIGKPRKFDEEFLLSIFEQISSTVLTDAE